MWDNQILGWVGAEWLRRDDDGLQTDSQPKSVDLVEGRQPNDVVLRSSDEPGDSGNDSATTIAP